MKLRSCEQLSALQGKRVLYRVDYNVALDSKGRVATEELFRLQRTLPTLTWLIRKRARVIIVSHRGRPRGENMEYTLKPVAVALGKLLGKPVKMMPTYHAESARRYVAALRPGQVMLMENVRFHPGEVTNDSTYAHQLAGLADVYISDAFATIHRETASTVGISEYLPSYAGFLMQEEVTALEKVMQKPDKPLTVLLGGAKTGTKIPVIEHLISKAHHILLGGVIANTFLKSARTNIAKSLYDEAMLPLAKSFIHSKKLILPKDVICDDTRTPRKVESMYKNVEQLATYDKIVDLGIETTVQYANIIRKSKTVFWNGPLGWSEIPQGSHASEALAEFIAALSHEGTLKSFIGGGETIALFSRLGLLDKITYVSTGGGALLAFFQNPDQPGLRSLVR